MITGLLDTKKSKRFQYPRNKSHDMTVSWCDDMNGYIWKAVIESNNTEVKYYRNDLPKDSQNNVLLTRQNITEIDFSFNKNLDILLTFVSNDIAYYKFNGNIIEINDAINPRCMFDSNNQELIIAYLRMNPDNTCNLCCLYESDGFTTEQELLTNSTDIVLHKIGMTASNRIAFDLQEE